MISVKHKLYPTAKQENYLSGCLWSAIGIENWALGQIRNTVSDQVEAFPLACMKPQQLRSVLSRRIKGHSAKCGLPSRLINDCIGAVITTVKKIGISKARCKSARKKNSFYFLGDIKIGRDGRLKLPGIKTTFRMSEQDKFQGRLKKVTLIKKWNGWYAVCVYDEERKPIKCSDSKKAGIDPGLKTAIVLSDGTEHAFPRWYQDRQELLGKLQRKSKHSKRVKALFAKIANKRLDHHHKLSTGLAGEYQKIYWSDDNFKGLIRIKNLGKSYANLGLGAFRDMLQAKLASRADGQGELIKVNSRYSTQTCNACGARTGPKGRSGLGVREWVCRDCGISHDRDRNAAINTLLSGRGASADLRNCISLEQTA